MCLFHMPVWTESSSGNYLRSRKSWHQTLARSVRHSRRHQLRTGDRRRHQERFSTGADVLRGVPRLCNVKQEIQLAWKHDTPILPLLLVQMLFPDDVSYWLEGAQWIEVLGKPESEWFDTFRRALALTGYRMTPPARSVPSTAPAAFGRLPPNNLPQRHSGIIGRDQQIRQLLGFFENSRLVTITGPGGTGKTRLAEEVAVAIAARFPDGIWFIDGAQASTLQGLVEIIASTLEVSEESDSTLLEAVSKRLSKRRSSSCSTTSNTCLASNRLSIHFLASARIALLATSRRHWALKSETVFR